MLELIISRDGRDLVSLPMEEKVLRVGRAATNDLSLPEPALSRHQCEITRSGDQVLLKDVSGKGTLVDGRRVRKAKLDPGTKIGFGDLTGSLRRSRDVATPTARLPGGGTKVLAKGQPAQHPLRLVGRVQGHPVQLRLTGEVLTVGTDPACDLLLADDYISAFHCRLVKKTDGWFIIDLDSTNGTQVDGIQVGEARLRAGTNLSLGQIRLAVEQDHDGHPGKTPDNFYGILSTDPIMQAVFDTIERAAPTEETLLITGETGVGKDLVARACTRLSRRSDMPMVSLNCAALSKDLLESELFGHEKGAFTGAQEQRLGLFEETSAGTLFLDEVGELSLSAQAKLLRVLENGEIRRVGGNQSIHVDTRVLCATHRSLADLVREERFRQDLYYRMCVIEIAIPPMRKRPQDIALLAQHFLAQATAHIEERVLAPSAREKLAAYRFPGNVRELRHIMTRAAILCDHQTIEAEHISFHPPTLADQVSESETYHQGKTLRDVEIDALRHALAACEGNRTAAARVLGIARSTLMKKMTKFGIHFEAVLSEQE